MGKVSDKWRKWRGVGAVLLALTGVGAPTVAVLLGVGDLVVSEVEQRQTEKEQAKGDE